MLSGGHIYILGEAYAFGVIWSFALKSLAVLVLRFTAPGPREWRVPVNLKIGRVEFPVGLAAITLALFSVAIVNLFTKEVATISGVDLHADSVRGVRRLGTGDRPASCGRRTTRWISSSCCPRPTSVSPRSQPGPATYWFQCGTPTRWRT